jgi:hypothetical protein
MSRLFRANALLIVGTAVLIALQWPLTLPHMSLDAPIWWCIATIAFMTWFDSELPNGDVVDMSAPLVAASALVAEVGTAATIGIVVVSRLVLLLLRREDIRASRVNDAALRAAFSVAAVGALTHRMLPVVAPDSAANVAPFALAAAASTVLFFALSFGAAQIQSAAREIRPLSVLVSGNLRLQGWMLAAQLSVAVLSVLVVARMGGWGLAIVVALLLVVRQAFTLLVDVRTAYRDTISLLARAMEAENPERLAHAERVAKLASSIGREVGLQGQRLEWLTNAALFHDMDLLGSDDLAAGEQLDLEPLVSSPGGRVVGEVKFLEPIARILSIVDAGGDTDESHDEFDIIAAYVVSRASEVDDALHHRPADTRRSEGVGRRLYADRRRELDSKIGRSAARIGATTDQTAQTKAREFR